MIAGSRSVNEDAERDSRLTQRRRPYCSLANRRDVPDFQANPTNVNVPLNGHVRRANPRAEPDDPERRIFKRGYPLMVPLTPGHRLPLQLT
jgi:hypothetical protein